MSRLKRAEEAARAAAALHAQSAVRLADEMADDPTSMDLPRLVDHHHRTRAARDYALAVWEAEVIESNARAAKHRAFLAEALSA